MSYQFFSILTFHCTFRTSRSNPRPGRTASSPSAEPSSSEASSTKKGDASTSNTASEEVEAPLTSHVPDAASQSDETLGEEGATSRRASLRLG